MSEQRWDSGSELEATTDDATDDLDEVEGVSVELDARDESPDDVQVEILAAEIDDTREELTETVQAIGDKLEPSNLAREAKETARQVTMGKVEQMSMGAQETWRDVRTGNAEGILEMITSNPIPSAMIGLGIGMLLLNRGGSAHSGRIGSGEMGSQGYGRHGWSSGPESLGYGDAGYRGGTATGAPETTRGRSRGGTGGGIGSAIDDVRDRAGDTISQVTDTASETADRITSGVGETASQMPEQMGQMIDQRGAQVRRLIDENPLAAGVVAVAAGAMIGMLVPTTQIERQTVGPQRDQLVGQAESAINEGLDSIDQSSGSASSGSSGGGSSSSSGTGSTGGARRSRSSTGSAAGSRSTSGSTSGSTAGSTTQS